jgi:hypothetical protein
MQGSFYAAAFYEQTGVAIKQTGILIAVDDNEPQLFVEPTFDYLPKLIDARKNYKNIYGF